MLHERCTDVLLGSAIAVHSALGPGLLESAYEACLCHELDVRGVAYARQVPLAIQYGGVRLDCGYRLDLVVEDKVVVEIKAIEAVLPIHEAQLLTYLRLSGHRVGMLINFDVCTLPAGVTRRVL
jgi:GxxExxY protein